MDLEDWTQGKPLDSSYFRNRYENFCFLFFFVDSNPSSWAVAEPQVEAFQLEARTPTGPYMSRTEDGELAD